MMTTGNLRGSLRSRFLIALGSALGAGALMATPAGAAFHIVDFTGLASDENGATYSQAGGHPNSVSVTFEFPTAAGEVPDGQPKDIIVDAPVGLVGNPAAVAATCTHEDFNDPQDLDKCPIASQVGTVEVHAEGTLIPNGGFREPLYNLVPPRGRPAMFGFKLLRVPILLYASVRTDSDYGITISELQTSQVFPLKTIKTTFWGSPYDSSHDDERIECARFYAEPDCSLPAETPTVAFVTNPSHCAAGPLTTGGRASDWANPSVYDETSFDVDSNGNPTEVTGCDKVPFEPSIDFAATTDQAQTPSGLEATVEFPDAGILNPDGIAQGYTKRAEITLPEGMTLNPSSAEGLGVCTPADLARETVTSQPGQGCPNSSRLGSVSIDTPVLNEQLEGSLYLAQQDDPSTPAPGAENPFDTLVALYVVGRSDARGIIVKLPGKVEPDPRTGRLVTTFDDLPQLPFSKFHLKFREGGRAPLVSPPVCGTFTTEADFVPWSAADPGNPQPLEIAHTTSQFQVTRGVGGGPCPSGGLPPFKPGLSAGTINNAAGSYSPFNLRLTRNDGEQEFTNFSIKLPPGVVGKLAGVPFCPDSSIAAAKTKTGGEELASPSCPKASEVGRTLVGAGVGSIQTYVPGKVYLAGPYNGSALSIAAITSAKVGPFDVGTVVIREALKVNPDTAEVFIDATGSDPIPHIIKGIPVHARDIRVYVDKSQFVLNPTSCKRTSTASTVLGSGLDFGSTSDDNPITVTSPFQAADCANLGFKPKLRLFLQGGTKRDDNPKFKAVLDARAGDANIGEAQVTLPRSEFLDQSHIKTVCTRVQYNAGAGNGAGCPKQSIYGYAKAITPLLDEPLQGPVFLRSSSHNLPDLVAALNSGKINIALDGRIDSVKGQIRNTFEEVPDAPVTRFTLTMQGGKKGLLVNSTNLCAKPHRAIVAFTGQNGKVHDFNPVVKPQCKGKARGKAKKKR